MLTAICGLAVELEPREVKETEGLQPEVKVPTTMVTAATAAPTVAVETRPAGCIAMGCY